MDRIGDDRTIPAEDIERRRRKREEREAKRGREMEGKGRDWRQLETIDVTEGTEETEDRGEKRPRTDTDTDSECMQSRQKKGQMKSILLSESDEEAIMDFPKKHEELFDMTHSKFKDKHRKDGLRNCCSFQEFTCQHCQEVI